MMLGALGLLASLALAHPESGKPAEPPARGKAASSPDRRLAEAEPDPVASPVGRLDDGSAPNPAAEPADGPRTGRATDPTQGLPTGGASTNPTRGSPSKVSRGEPTPEGRPPGEVPRNPEAEGLEARFASDEAAGLDSIEAPSFGRAFLEMVLVLGGVCLLAYLVLGKLLPRVLRVPAPSASGRLLSVVDRLAIDPRRSILVIRMGEHHFLVGNAENGMSMLARLDARAVQEALDAARMENPSPAPWVGLTSLLHKRKPFEESP